MNAIKVCQKTTETTMKLSVVPKKKSQTEMSMTKIACSFLFTFHSQRDLSDGGGGRSLGWLQVI